MIKKILVLFFILISTGFFQSCVDKIVVADSPPSGKLIINSEPAGAQIFLQGTNTYRLTPDSIINLKSGNYTVTLKKQNYKDTTLTAAVFDSLRTTIDVLLESLISTGQIYIESDPPGSAIFLDSVNTNKVTPDTLFNITVGEHKITLKKANYLDTTFVFTILKNKTISQKVTLTNVLPKGSMYVASTPPGAQIFVDSINTNKVTPDTLENVTTGNHYITLKKANYVDTSFTLTVQENKIVSKSVVLTNVVIKGNVFITSDPAGAQVFVDNVNSNKVTPDTLLNLSAGHHNLILKKQDYRDTTFQVNVIGNSTISKSIKLTSTLGNVFITSVPAGAQIFLDNVNSGKLTPDTLKSIPVGNHNIILKKQDYRDTAFQVTVVSNSTISKSVQLAGTKGNIFISSTPSGAKIFLDGIDSKKVTPDSLSRVSVGVHNITLKKQDFRDTSVSITVTSNSTVSKNILLTSTKGSIYLQSNPAGAGIYINNNFTNKTTPDTIKNLDPAEYKVTLKYSGYNDSTFYVTVSQNKISSKNITLTKVIDRGSLYITSDPSGAKIYISGSNTGKVTPDTIKGLEVGDYNVSLKLSDYLDANFSVTIKKNLVTEKDITLQEKLPVQIDTLYYGKLFGQLRFTFSFNQDITLDKVDVSEPGSTDKTTFNFGNLYIQKDALQNIYYPSSKNGTWTLIFYGNKTSVSKASFAIEKTLQVK